MDTRDIVSLIGGAVAIITALVAVFRTRGETKAQSDKSKVDRDKYIDERVDGQLEKAYARITELEESSREQDDQIMKLKGEVVSLKEDRDKMSRMNERVKQVVQWWFADLLRWDNNGRVGPMPLPSPGDMQLLELEDLNDTKTRTEVLRLRSNHLEEENDERKRPRH